MKLSAVVLVWLCAMSPAAFGFSSLQPTVTRDLRFKQHPGAQLPLGAVFRDSTGRAIRLGEVLRDKPVVLVMEYLRCRSLCSYVLRDTIRGLAGTPLVAGRDYDLVAISVDPRDTPGDALHARTEYLATAATHSAGAHFLVGKPSDIHAVADAVGFPFRYDPQIDQYAHPAGITVVAPGGVISRYILGLGYRPLDLRLALTEASRGTVSTPVTDLLLLCYCYDPATGRYGLAINTILRIAGLATVLGLAFWVFRLSRPVIS